MPTSIRTFASIEQLDELPRELGWPLEYRQIEAGSFSSTFTDVEGDTWFLMEEQSSRHVEVVAGAPHGMYILALMEGIPVVVNGMTFSCDHIFLQPPGSDLRATLPGGTKVLQIGILDEYFQSAVHAIAPDLLIPRGDVALFATAPGRLATLRQTMRAAILAPSNRVAAREEVLSRVLTDIISVAFDHGNAQLGSDLHRANAWRALNRAMEYIEAHVNEAIRVASLCSYSGTTLRSLERIFARELGISPQKYLMSRRLNAVRRYLLKADDVLGISITEVALSHEFTHLWRFAGDYRSYFGETPRETLQSR